MSEMVAIAQRYLEAIITAVKASNDGTKRALHPANPAEADAIHAFLALMGKSADSHPALHDDIKQLAAAKPRGADHDGQVLTVVDQGRDAQGRATARVWHQDTEGGFTAGSLALVLDAASRRPLALGFANKVGGGLAPAATRAESAQPATERITTVGFYHVRSAPDEAPKFGMIAQSRTLAAEAPIVPDVIDPFSKNGYTQVAIALGRPNFLNKDADYLYQQNTNSSLTPPFIVPFTGTVNVQQPLAYLDSTGHFTQGLLLRAQLYSLTNSAFIGVSGEQKLADFVTGSGKVVTWNFPYDPDQNPSDPPPAGTPQGLVYDFNEVTGNIVNNAAFFFQFVIPVDNLGPPTVTTSVCSTDWPEPHSDNCRRILNLGFWWHCLAEGTQITLADGSALAVENVDNTKRVRTGSGKGTLGVEATTRGLHHVVNAGNPAARVYRLTTLGGRALVLTGGHPVAVEDGLISACDIKPGMAVRTEEGADAVASCEPVADGGMFCNLKLIDAEDRARGLSGAVGTFIANGIVVGDVPSMTQLHYNNTHSLDYMMARIPARLHKDYASTLDQIVRDNVRYGGNF